MENGIRSRGASDPKAAGQQAVALHTAESGPPGPKLRGKYLHHAGKSFGKKKGGNSGGVGRAARRYNRMHGGGQVSAAEMDRRKQQSTLDLNSRDDRTVWKR
jgi:hypothetical protein